MTEFSFSLVLDFDSTIVQVEALDILPDMCCPPGSDREELRQRIAAITARGMEGHMSISDSLAERLKLLRAHRDHIPRLIDYLCEKISPSMISEIGFFKRHRSQIYVITSGFEEYVLPVVSRLHVLPSHVWGNRFVYSPSGAICGFDLQRLPGQPGGKSAQLRTLQLPQPIIAVGDGVTDLEMKRDGLTHTFVAYVETVSRDVVIQEADLVATAFSDVVAYIESL